MAEGKVKFALIGCGYIGQRYIQILTQHPNCELTALVDPNKAVLSKDQPLPFFTSIEQLFQSGIKNDAVIIATPNGTHASLALKSLQQGKHVLIEKPMALSKKDAEAIVQVSNEVNKKIMVVLQNRFSPVSVWLKKTVESGILGTIFFVDVHCFWNRDERYYKKGSWHGTKDLDGGTLFTQFSHFVDMLYWLFGDIQNISSRFTNFNHQQLTGFEDTGSIHFEWQQGGMGCFNFSTAVWDQSLESSMTIIAQNGSIKISGQYVDKIERCHIKDYNLPQLNCAGHTGDNHFKVMDAFIEAIQGDGPTNVEEALHSVDIIERMYASDYGL